MSTGTREPLEQVSAYRPSADLLDQEWPAGRRAALLDRLRSDAGAAVRSAPAAPRVARRRWPIAAALAGVAAAALLMTELLVPAGTPGGSPNAAAATLERLAVTAAATPADLVKPGQYRHLVDRIHQGPQVMVLESWTSYRGYIWRRDTDQSTTRYYAFAPGGDDLSNPSPEFLNSLPTAPTELIDYLRSHLSGSTSIFAAVGDMLRGGCAPPALRAAAIRALEHTSHITATAAHDSLGRAAVKITFSDGAGGPESLLFDRDTSALLEEQQGPHFTATYTRADTVDAVPAIVTSHAGK